MNFSSNFQFIEPCSQQLAELGKKAERLYTLNESIHCLIALRTYTEFLVELVTVELGIYVPEVSLIDRLRRIEAVFQAQKANIGFILEKLHTLRIDGNRAVHDYEYEGDSQTAAANLRIAYEMGIWYCRAFRHIESSPPPFELPELQPQINIPQTQDWKSIEQEYQKQLERIKLEIERLNREAQVEKEKGSENLALSIHQAKEATDLIRAIITDTAHESGLNAPSEWSEGFDRTADLFQNAELVLRQISALIGERSSEPIQLLSGESILPGLGLVNDATALTARAADIHQGVFKLIVIGEFKHGKSTLLNAMLGGKVLPVSAVPATAVITMLVAGDEQQVEIYDVGKEQPRIMRLEAFNGSSVLSMLNYLNLVLKALHSNALRIISTKSML